MCGVGRGRPTRRRSRARGMGDGFEERPPREEALGRARVERGAWVKVGLANRKRFWCRVTRLGPNGAIVATVDNDLVTTTMLKYGDQVVLQPRHVLETADVADMLRFVHWAHSRRSTLGPTPAAASE